MQNGDEGLSSIILSNAGILVKMLIALEQQWYICIKFCKLILIHFRIIKTQVCKMVILGSAKIYGAKPSHRFAYMCLYNVKCIRTSFHTKPISEWLNLATKTLFLN